MDRLAESHDPGPRSSLDHCALGLTAAHHIAATHGPKPLPVDVKKEEEAYGDGPSAERHATEPVVTELHGDEAHSDGPDDKAVLASAHMGAPRTLVLVGPRHEEGERFSDVAADRRPDDDSDLNDIVVTNGHTRPA